MRVLIACLMVLFILVIMGCNSTSYSHVGKYKDSGESWEIKQTIKVYGHTGYDIRNPTSQDIEYYCILCHYVS